MTAPRLPEAAPEVPRRAKTSALERGDAGAVDAFRNLPLLDFGLASLRQAFAAALRQVERSLPLRVSPVVAGKLAKFQPEVERFNPSQPEQCVARLRYARPEEVEEALEIAALQCFEVAKPWREADADVAEAIDFCRFYARRALIELSPQRLPSPPGEDNQQVYEGVGPCVILAPWNFPLAILCGMTVAALVAGNPVLIKPAEQSSAIASLFVEHLLAAGAPPEVVHFLPGRGEEVGAHLVGDARVALIAFTGSEKVGLEILRKAAELDPARFHLKHIVCEMGGKNAIVVDADADLDEALSGILQSAFGYAGQKCSACSRLIVVDAAYEELMPRLLAATADLEIGAATSPSTQLGPVIDAEAQARLHAELEGGIAQGKLLFRGTTPAQGFFVPPTWLEVESHQHRWMQEEFFGPLVALMRVSSFAEAIAVANSTRFALTGAVYSRLPSHLALAREAFRVGNLYLNRGSTGALVQRQPFGGFGRSGGGTKAGGAGYLMHFVHPRVLTENTSRRGFAPELGS